MENYAKSNVAAKTFEGYTEFVRKHFTPALGHHPLAKLQPLHIQAYYTKALESGRRDGKGGLSARTVLHHHRVLREALQQAVKWQLLVRNPADAVEPPRPEQKQMAVLDEDQAKRLLTAAEGTRLHIPVLLAVTTGMRRGEILGLRWTDVDLTTGTAAVRQALGQTKAGMEFKTPKTQKSRRLVVLPQFVADELRRHKGQQAQQKLLLGPGYKDQSLVVAQADGSAFPPNILSIAFATLVKQAGLKVTFHGLRHTHATHLFLRKVHPKIVSERLGHSNIGITLDIYSHVLPGMQEEAARHIEEVFRPVAVGT